MDKFLAGIPKNTLAFLAIVGGMLLIILTQPPVSVCDAQLDVIKASQRLLLFKDPKSKMVKTTKFETLRDRCKATNDPGGCYELFQASKLLLQDLETLSRDCASAAGGVPEIKRALWDTMDLLVRLAWGEKPPSAYAKFGWLDTADVSLFCKMKNRLQVIFGEPTWNRYRDKMMVELPGAKELPRNQVWDMSIFSENCARYP